MGKDVALERKFDVELVNMPFGSLQTPSIGLSLLQAALDRCNISSRVFYFTFRFAELIGPSSYSRVTTETHSHDLVGEWIFSAALFPERSESALKLYVTDVLDKRLNGPSQSCAYLRPDECTCRHSAAVKLSYSTIPGPKANLEDERPGTEESRLKDLLPQLSRS